MTYEEAKELMRGVPPGMTLTIDGEDASITHRQTLGSFILRKGGRRQACGFYTAANFLKGFEEDQVKVTRTERIAV